MKWNYLGAMMLASVATSSLAKEKAQREKPNIIYFLVDDMGIGDISVMGQQKYSTPQHRQTRC